MELNKNDIELICKYTDFIRNKLLKSNILNDISDKSDKVKVVKINNFFLEVLSEIKLV
jgi:hypothetical protein